MRYHILHRLQSERHIDATIKAQQRHIRVEETVVKVVTAVFQQI